MSSTIDEKVVELKFDNKQFESAVKESLSTLEKLQQATSKNISAKSFEGLTKAAKSFDVSNISSGLQLLEKRFSTLGIAGMRVIENITDGLMNGLGGAIHSVTNSIVQGGIKRAMNIENAHFQLQGLISDEKEVQAIMQQANDSVDGTAYSYDVAARAASMFAASGLKSGQQMENALKGIAGTAATANADYERVSELFTTIAGKGRIMAVELNRFASMGMNAAAALTNYMNDVNSGAVEATENVTNAVKEITNGTQITEADLRDLVSDGVVSFEIFSEAMATTFGDHAKDANKTFTGSMANIRAALARTGAMFISPLIQQDGPFVQFFNAVRIKVNEFNKALGAANGLAQRFTTWVNKMVTSLTAVVEGFEIANVYTRTFGDGVEKTFTDAHHKILKFGDGTKRVMQGDFYTPFTAFTDLVESVVNIFKAIGSVIAPIGRAFKEAFAFDVTDLYMGIEMFNKWTRTLKISGESAELLHTAFKGLFDIIRAGISLFVRLLESILPMSLAVGDLGDTVLTLAANFGEFLSGIAEIATSSETIDGIFDGIRIIATETMIALSTLFSFIREHAHIDWEEVFGFFDINGISGVVGSVFDSIKSYFSEVFSTISDGVKKYLNKLPRIIDNVKDVLDKTWDVAKRLLKALGDIISKLDPLKTFLQLLSGALFINIFDKLMLFIKRAMNLPKLMGDIGTKGSLLQTISSSIAKFTNDVGQALGSLSHELDAKALKEIAIAVAILAGSLFLLSTLSFEEITKGLTAITVLLGEMMGAMYMFTDVMTKSYTLTTGLAGVLDAAKIGILAKALMDIALSIIVLSVAVKILGSMKLEDIAKGLGAVTILLVEMIGTIAILSTLNIEKMTSVGIGIILIAGAIGIIGSAIKKLGALDVGSIVKGLLSVIVIIMSLATFTAIAGGAEKMMSIGFAMIMLGAAIKIISSAIKGLAELNINQLAKGLMGIVGVIMALAIFTMMTDGSTKILEVAIGMIALSFAIKMLTTSMQSIGGMSLDGIAKAIIGLGAALYLLISVLDTLGTSNTNRGSIVALGILVGMIYTIDRSLVPSLLKLSAISWQGLAKSLIGLGVTLTVMANTIGMLAGVTEQYGRYTTAKALGVFAGFAATMNNPIAEFLMKLAAISWDHMTVALVGMGATLTIMANTMERFSSYDFKKSLGSVIILAIAIRAMLPIADMLKTLSTMGIEGAVVGVVALGFVLAELTGVLYALSQFKVESVLMGAFSLLIAVRAILPVAGMLNELGKMSWSSVVTSLIAFGGAMAILIGAMYVAGVGAESGIPLMGALLIALLVFTIQPIVPLMQGLGSIGWSGVASGLAALGGAMLILISAMYLAGLAAVGGVTAAIPALGALLLAFIINTIQPIVPLMQGLGSMSWDSVKTACLGLAASLGILIIAMYLAGLCAPAVMTGTAAITAIVNGIQPLPGIMKRLGSVDWESMKGACKNLITSLASLLICAVIFAGIGPIATAAGAGLSIFVNIMASAMDPLVKSIKDFSEVMSALSDLDEAKFDKAVKAVGTMLKEFGTSLKSFQLFAGVKANALPKLAEALKTMVPAFRALNRVDPEKVGTGLTKIGESLTAFGKSLKAFNVFTSGIKSEAIKTLAEGVGAMAPGLTTLSFVPGDKLKATMTAIGEGFKAFGEALKNTPFWGSGMRANGIVTLCEGISTLTEVLPDFIAIAGGEGGRYAKQALNMLGDAFKQFGLALKGTPFWGSEDRASGINALCEGIRTLTDVLPGFIAIFSGEGGRYVTQSLNTLGTAFKNFGTAVGNAPLFNAEERATGIVTIVGSITTLSDGLKTFIQDVGTGEEVKSAFSIIGGAFANFGRAIRQAPIFNADERGTGIATLAANIKNLAQGVKDFITICSETDATTLQRVMTLIQTAFMDFGVALRTAGFINPQGKADAIVTVVNSVDTLADGVERFIKMEPDVDKLSTIMDTIGATFKKFGGAIKAAGFWDVEGRANAVVAVVDSIGTLVDCVERVKGINITYLGQLLGAFSTGITNIGTALQSFDEMATANAAAVGDVVENISSLVQYGAEDFNGAISGIQSLIGVLTNIGKFDTASLTQFNTALKKTATEGLQTFLDAFTTKAEEAVTAVKTLMDAIIQALDEYTDDFEQMGKKHGEAYIKGLRSMYEQAYTAGKMLGMKAYSGLELQIKNFERIGILCAQGFANGLKSSEALKAIADAAAAVGQQAVTATQNAVQTQSPSRVFMRIGSYCGEGLAIGLYQWADAVAEAGNSLGESAKTGLQMAVENLNNHMDEIVDLNPTITPVVDLTYASAAASKINSMFSSAMFRTSSDVRSVSSMVQGGRISGDSEEIQNGRFGNNYTFVQNNNSPKALSRIDIYRDTRSLFKQYREAVEGV